MWFVGPNQQLTASITGIFFILFGNLLFLDENSADLVVIFDETPFIAARSCTTESALQRIENIFQAIVDIVDGKTFPFAQIKQNNNFQLISLIILNPIRRLQNVGENLLAPLLTVPLIRRKLALYSTASCSHSFLPKTITAMAYIL